MSFDTANSIFPACDRLTNVTFFDCTWETGLKEAVANARVVVNPSLWSAPIEGAFLKSVAFNGNVAVVESKFGFSSEQMFNKFTLQLPANPQKAAGLLEEHLDNNKQYQVKAHRWLDNFNHKLPKKCF